MNFCLQNTGHASREQLAIINCKEPYRFAKSCDPAEIPIGDISFCESVFGDQPLGKNFYPSFLQDYFKREIHLTSIDEPVYLSQVFRLIEGNIFIKSAEVWKSNARVWSRHEYFDDCGLYWISEVVNFINEWRYYVANGKLITTGWYLGQDEDKVAPDLNINWPEGFSGAVDFGELDNGEIALVECHAPFACGWYGEDPSLYVEWQKDAWKHSLFWKVNNDRTR